MNNKHILVTGASSGLGKEITKKLSQEGFTVLAGVRKEEDKTAIESLNKNIKGVILDVTNDQSVQSAFEQVSSVTDKLDAIVNNAGIAVAGPVECLGVEFIKEQFEVNVWGAIRVAQTFMPLLKDTQDARIVNISSMASYGVFPFVSPYCASKRALDMFFNSLLIEAKMPNLKVISIKPGVVRTPIWDKSIHAAQKNLENLCEAGREKYEKELLLLAESASKNNEKGLAPEAVADLAVHVLKVKNPKLSYTIGSDAKMAELFSKFPQSWVNFLIKKGLEKKLG